MIVSFVRNGPQSSDVTPPSTAGIPQCSVTPMPSTSGPSRPPGLQSQSTPLNPAMNDAPLEFNKNAGKPPVPVVGSMDEDNDSDEPAIIMEEITVRQKGDRDSRERESQRDRDERLRDRDRIRERERDRDRGRDRDRERERDRDRDRDRDRRERDRDRDRNGRDRRERKITEGNEVSNGLLPNPDILGPNSAPMAGPLPVPNSTLGPAPVPNLVPGPGPGPGPGGAGGPGIPGPGPGPIVPGPNMPNNLWGGMMNPMMGMMGSMMGPMMGMGMDPGMMGMSQFGMMGGMMPDGTVMGPDGAMMPPDPNLLMATHPPEEAGIAKEIVHCKECTLFPPNPNAPVQSTRERPLGCRTIFVGGLPDNATEDMIREIFERCGEIQTIRMSKKNFCHVRFMFENSVEAAFYFSGYRMRIGSNTDSPNTGRLHVDYAQARDDFHEWECAQRQLQREARHRQRMEQERLHPPSPPPVAHYSEHESVVIAEKIKGDESFGQAVQTLITWLERGNCNKRNSNQFYSMIQAANSHVRRLLNEKAQLEEELQTAKDLYKGRMQNLLIQFGDIERVFTSASHKKVWDHFTKAQRKNIDLWKKQSMEIKTVQLEDAVLHNEEMDVSDEEDSNQKKKLRDDSPTVFMSDSDTLKEENDSLRCQLEAYKNEVDLVRTDLKAELSMKEQQLKMVQQTMQGLQQKLLEGRRKQLEDEVKIRDLTARLVESSKSAKSDMIADNEKSNEGCDKGDESRHQTVDSADISDPKSDTDVGTKITDHEAKLIGVISAFLHVHPFGAGIDYVWSYLQKMEPSLRPSDVEGLLTRFPTVFKQELCGIGANMERRWQFAGFSSLDRVLM